MILAAVSKIMKLGTAAKLGNAAIFIASAIEIPAEELGEPPAAAGLVSSIVIVEIFGFTTVPLMPFGSALIRDSKFAVESTTDMLITCALALTVAI